MRFGFLGGVYALCRAIDRARAKRQRRSAEGLADDLERVVRRVLGSRGRGEGKREGKAASVLLVLEARGLEVSEEQRARVEACRDSETLTRWLAAAATAASSDAALG